jgi:hypothetical protein
MIPLTRDQLATLRGGDIVDVIDGACASIALGAVFFSLNPITKVGGAFCAGWGIGRALS